MTHDPLCVEPQADYPCKRCWEIECECLCICDILAKVREDERRERMELEEGIAYLKGHFDQAERRGRNIGIQDCIAAVEALDVCWYADNACQSPNHGILNEVYLALRALEDKP